MKRELIENEAEQLLRDGWQALLSPRPGECLVCYVSRQLAEFGCDNTHRFVLAYRDSAAPRASALVTRLARMGACCCDCEVLMNAYEPVRSLWTAGSWRIGPTGFEQYVDAEPPIEMPPCAVVRRGSTQPCAHWTRAGW